MDAGKRHETPRSGKKDFIIHNALGGMSFKFVSFVPLQVVREVMCSSPGECCTSSGFASPWGTSEDPELRNPQSILRWLQADFANLCPGGKNLNCTVQQTNLPPTLKRYTPSVFQGCSLYKHPWKDNQGRKKRSKFLCLHDMQKCEQSLENYFPTSRF